MTSLRTWISFSLFFRLHNACKNCMSYYCVFFSTPLLILDRERVTVPNPMRPKSQKAPPKNHSKVTRDHCCCSVSIPACTVSIPATITNLYLYLIICRSDSGLLSAELPLSLHVMVDKTSLQTPYKQEHMVMSCHLNQFCVASPFVLLCRMNPELMRSPSKEACIW